MCNCNNTILISEIVDLGDAIGLIPNRPIAKEKLGNMCKYNLILGCGLECTNSFPVVLELSDAKVPLLDKVGNEVFFNQMRRTRYAYCIGYGNRNPNYADGQLIVFNNLCLPSPAPAAPAFFNKKGKKDKDKEDKEEK